MFETLNSIDWNNLSHAYGKAGKVPEHLADLTGESKQRRTKALNYFWEMMVHQGSRYEASSQVVPFLFEVLDQPNCRVKRKLIDLLLGIAVGLGESFLPFGYDLEEEERRFHRQTWNGLYGCDKERDAYDAVLKRSELFTTFLDPRYPSETRLSAAFAVANFAQKLSAVHVEVADYILREQDESQVQSLILCFGMLGRYCKEKPNVECLKSSMSPNTSKSLQVSAAISLTTIFGPETPDSAVQLMLLALKEAWVLQSPRASSQWWNEGDLLGHAAIVLRLVGPERRNDIARALCEALVKSETCTFAIPQTLLEILFPDANPATGRDPSEFDDIQRATLNILLRTRHWRTWMISTRFLPSGLEGDAYQSALQGFVREITGDSHGGFGDLGNVSSWDFDHHWPQAGS